MDMLVSVLQSLLVVFQSVFLNWGLSLMALTSVVRLGLFPVQIITYVQQMRLKQIKPELDKLQKQLKNDPPVLFKKASELRRKAGVKTWLMLLSVLIQIPIFIAVYRVVTSTPGLVGASFAWLNNLSVPDPFFILPLLVAAAAYLQQKLNLGEPTSAQLKIMPLFSFAFMVTLPAGLALYYATGGFLQLLGDWVIKKLAT